MRGMKQLLAYGRVGWPLRWWIHGTVCGGDSGRGGTGLEQKDGEREGDGLGRIWLALAGFTCIRARVINLVTK